VRVAFVVDGDTIELSDGRQVRLLQLDAPEGGEHECFADAARDALRRLLPRGTSVRLEPDPELDRVDRFGRLLRYVYAREDLLNLRLVQGGFATPYFFRGERGRYAGELLDGAEEAQAAGRGLWSACPTTRLDPERPATTGRAEP
jgi:micrococcal nuclease